MSTTRYRICQAINRIAQQTPPTATQITSRTTLHISTVRKNLSAMRADGTVLATHDAKHGYTYRVVTMPAKPRKAKAKRSKAVPKSVPVTTSPGIKATANRITVLNIASVAHGKGIVGMRSESLGVHELGSTLGLGRHDLQQSLHALHALGVVEKVRQGTRWVYSRTAA